MGQSPVDDRSIRKEVAVDRPPICTPRCSIAASSLRYSPMLRMKCNRCNFWTFQRNFNYIFYFYAILYGAGSQPLLCICIPIGFDSVVTFVVSLLFCKLLLRSAPLGIFTILFLGISIKYPLSHTFATLMYLRSFCSISNFTFSLDILCVLNIDLIPCNI